MTVQENLISDVHKIAVLRANAIGDFIFTLPALEALRKTYPHAEIVYLGKKWHTSFLSERPSPVDRVIVVPNSEELSGNFGTDLHIEESMMDEFYQQLREEAFDLAFQMHGGGRNSNPFILNIGARMTIGLKTPDAPPLDRWVPYIYFQHEVLRFLEVVSLAGAEPVGLEPRLAVTPADVAESLRIVPQDERSLVVIHPGAGDPRRRWPAEKFAAVGDALARAGAHVLISGTQPERPVVEAVLASMQIRAESICDQLSLGGFAGLLSRAALLISNDSGPLHLAGAVGAKTVGIFWCGNLINAGAFSRSRHRALLSWRLDCPICGRNTIYDNCEHHVSFVDRVQVAEVLTEAMDLLGYRSSDDSVSEGNPWLKDKRFPE